MLRYLAPTLLFAVAVFGCDKKSDASGGGATAPPGTPVSANQTGPQNSDPIDPATVGSIKGVVKLDGWLKPDGPNGEIGGVPACAAHWKGNLPLRETLVMGEGQTMANVLVYVKNGLGNRKFDVPKNEVFFDQVGCVYTPHAHAIRANQPLTIRNGDAGLMHNVRGTPALNESFNKGQLNKGDQNTFHFPIPEIGIEVQCNVHPWMSAWLHVVGHPFFQLTGKDGAYKLEGLPPGEYEIQAWHERFKSAPMVAMVTVKAKEATPLDFTFKGGEKPSK